MRPVRSVQKKARGQWTDPVGRIERFLVALSAFGYRALKRNILGEPQEIRIRLK
jgi:hypothetical protein